MLHLNKMINLDTGALQTETMGEKIVHKLQEYLLSKMSPGERAILPEDKIQRLLLGVCDFLYSIFQQYAQETTTSVLHSHSLSCDSLQACNQLELATHIEMTASLLHQDAIAVIKTALAGTQTDRLVNILEAAFVGEEKSSLPSSDPLGEEKEEEDKALEALLSEHSKASGASTSTLSKALKQKLPPPSEEEAKRPPSHPSKGGVITLKEASPLFPTIAHKGQYLHIGVNSKFISSRVSSSNSTKAGYYCQFSSVSKEEGKLVPECEFFSTTKAQLSTHICQHHLGLTVTCFVCNKCWWLASSWFSHMEKIHVNLKEDDYFIRSDAEAQLLEFHGSGLVVKEEVAAADV